MRESGNFKQFSHGGAFAADQARQGPVNFIGARGLGPE
jgi:hypothetical protein